MEMSLLGTSMDASTTASPVFFNFSSLFFEDGDLLLEYYVGLGYIGLSATVP